MQVKDIVASTVLGLLFVSLLVIYFVADQNPLVTGLGIIIIAICLFIVRVGDWREIGIIGSVTALVSGVAVYLFALDRYGNVGAILLTVAWAMVLMGMFAWFATSARLVPDDRALLSVRTFSGETVNAQAPVTTSLPFLERPLATIPLYPLSADEVVKDINTQAKGNVTELHVNVKYQVTDRDAAPRAMARIPNRGLVQEKVAKALNKTVEQARTDVLFWERLLDEQIRAELDDVVRMIFRKNASNPHDAKVKQFDIEQMLLTQLNDNISNWGVTATKLAIDKMVIPDGAWPKKLSDDEEEAKRQKTNAERIRTMQEAQSQAEADRVRRLIEAVREAGVENIPEPLLEDIIVSATSDPGDRAIDMELDRWFNQNFKPESKK